MMTHHGSSLAFCLTLCLSIASGQDAAQRQRDFLTKSERILRIQDARSPVNGPLLQALGDADAAVRGRAALAAASIQDTTLLDHLVRLLDDPIVSAPAAFAIGQTGIALSPAGRQRLEQDLLWNRLRTAVRRPEMLDALGKFCTADGLDEMLNKLDAAPDAPTTAGLICAVARSAVRGVTTDRAVTFLLRQTVAPETTPWMVVYALQRLGPRPEVLQQFDRLLPLRTHPDPLVRMHYAALLGKLSGQRDVRDALTRMAEEDADHRVRVNALRSLSGTRDFDPEVFRRTLYSPDQHLQVVAIQGIGSAPWLGELDTPAAHQLLSELEELGTNRSGGYHWQVQAEAILALARLRGMIFHLPTRPEQRAYELRALAVVRPPTTMVVFEQEARAGDPQAAVAALEGTLVVLHAERQDTSLRTRARVLAGEALARNDVAITATAATLLADSLLVNERTAPLLLEALSRLSISSDLEGILAVLEALGATGDTRAVPALIEQLRSLEPAVAQASARALRKITGRDYSRQIPERGVPLYTDYDFSRLWGLPDTVRMTIETVRGMIPIEVYPRDAPFTVLNFLRLATERHFFDGLTFHRVVPNFVVQGGDPRGDGWGGPGYTIRSEFPPKLYETGSIGMASAGKDTEGSQFFITHSPQPHLDGRYTVFGRVASGQEIVDQLQVGDRILTIRSGW